MVVALIFLYVARQVSLGLRFGDGGWVDAAFVVLNVALFAASRDALRKYYDKGSKLLGTTKGG